MCASRVKANDPSRSEHRYPRFTRLALSYLAFLLGAPNVLGQFLDFPLPQSFQQPTHPSDYPGSSSRQLYSQIAANQAATMLDDQPNDLQPGKSVMEGLAESAGNRSDIDSRELVKRIEALETELQSTREEKLSKEKKEKEAKERADKEKVEAERKKHGWLDMSNEKWNVRLGGHIQMDYITWPSADPAIAEAENYFSYRRLRLVADGTGYGVYDFRLQMTLEPGQGAQASEFASPDVKDAYVSMNEIPILGRMRIGNFFVPFSLEQVTNDTNNIFNERSIPTQGIFAADREVGVAFYNCTADKNVSWATGLFFDDINDTVKTRISDSQGYRLSGRLNWLPYFDEPSDGRYLIHTGLGVLHTNDFDDRVRFRARPQIQRGPVLIDSGSLIADSYTTGNLELAVVWGAVTMQNEAFLSQVDRMPDRNAVVGGAYSHFSWFLTGENRVYERFGQHGAQFGRNRPFTNLFATRSGCGWGAWEAKVRWSHLNLTDVDRGQYNDLTIGFNWYWSDRTRIMFDWIQPFTSSDTVLGRTSSDLFAMRFDVNW